MQSGTIPLLFEQKYKYEGAVTPYFCRRDKKTNRLSNLMYPSKNGKWWHNGLKAHRLHSLGQRSHNGLKAHQLHSLGQRSHNGLKAQYYIAQGNALGSMQEGNLRPVRAKVYKHSSLYIRLLPFQGALLHPYKTQGNALGIFETSTSAL